MAFPEARTDQNLLWGSCPGQCSPRGAAGVPRGCSQQTQTGAPCRVLELPQCPGGRLPGPIEEAGGSDSCPPGCPWLSRKCGAPSLLLGGAVLLRAQCRPTDLRWGCRALLGVRGRWSGVTTRHPQELTPTRGSGLVSCWGHPGGSEPRGGAAVNQAMGELFPTRHSLHSALSTHARSCLLGAISQPGGARQGPTPTLMPWVPHPPVLLPWLPPHLPNSSLAAFILLWL